MGKKEGWVPSTFLEEDKPKAASKPVVPKASDKPKPSEATKPIVPKASAKPSMSGGGTSALAAALNKVVDS